MESWRYRLWWAFSRVFCIHVIVIISIACTELWLTGFLQSVWPWLLLQFAVMFLGLLFFIWTVDSLGGPPEGCKEECREHEQ